jgi:hypothetical protein
VTTLKAGYLLSSLSAQTVFFSIKAVLFSHYFLKRNSPEPFFDFTRGVSSRAELSITL